MDSQRGCAAVVCVVVVSFDTAGADTGYRLLVMSWLLRRRRNVAEELRCL